MSIKRKKMLPTRRNMGSDKKKGSEEDNSTRNKKGKQNEGSGSQTRRKNADDENKRGSVVQPKEQAVRGSGSSESETEEVTRPRKTFQRRQIVSNWEKYELRPDDETKAEARGESFEKLLSMSGDAIAHFRFKDEQEWDVVEGLADSKLEEANGDQFGKYLSIDTQQIGEAMACLPLYRVLGLNRDIFPSDEVASMEATACEKREVFMQEYPIVPSALSSSSESDIAKCLDQCNLASSSEDSIKIPVNSTSKDQGLCSLNLNRTSISPNTTQSCTMSEEDKTHRTSNSFNASPVSACQTLNDEDLDALLDLDTPQESSARDATNVQLQQSTGTTPSDLSHAVTRSEDINALDSNSANANAVQQHKIVSPGIMHKADSTTKESKDVDLEDWLDSILDD